MSNDKVDSTTPVTAAVDDFYSARRKAAIESIVAAFTGRSADLLPYNEIRNKLRAIESSRRELKEINIASIVGSVNRYTDFSRSFLPRNESDKDRWAHVRMGVNSLQGLPPIEVYQIGDVYFVLDGHHRVSVARELGADQIQAYVTPVYTRVPLTPGDNPNDLILKSEYADFLEQTHIDDLRPGSNLMLTAPGQYQKLLEHISVHRYLMSQDQSREIPYAEALTDWYDTVYMPIVELIQQRGLLRDFPGRTVTDLYLWIMEHRTALGGGQIGWEVPTEQAAEDLRERFSPVPKRRLPRFLRKLQKRLFPSTFESGPPIGQWRRERLEPHRSDHLFDDLLVTVTAEHPNWQVVDLAIEIARREKARLTGMHVVTDPDEKDSEAIQQLREAFTQRCAAVGVAGRLMVNVGSIAEQICERSPWVDLVVFRLSFPPPTEPLPRLRSGARSIIRFCSAPLLAVPNVSASIDSALLAYGPGPKADEALFVATYLAGQWGLPLVVLTVESHVHASSPLLKRARAYLEEHGVQATYAQERGDPANSILQAAEKHNSSIIVMGGYESAPLLESIKGSTLDEVLRSVHRPVLICS